MVIQGAGAVRVVLPWGGVKGGRAGEVRASDESQLGSPWGMESGYVSQIWGSGVCDFLSRSLSLSVNLMLRL